jgi:XTP/dITP diphosphohydrolase
MDLLVATTNQHKLAEIRKLLSPLPIRLETLESFPGLEEPEETGATFTANARLKATYYSQQTGQPAVAEDSGLEIDALDGEPGIRSARFNGETYPEKFAVIYDRLRACGSTESTARFVCALAVANGPEVTFETLGIIEGRIADTPAGEAGFGYDPIFFYPPYGRTLAQVSAEEKAAVSHRGQAFRTFRSHLETVLRGQR